MKNNKGFTLVEIIGVVIILGILAIITIPLFTSNLEGFRDDFYANMEATILNSGKEFFSDNRKYRPNKYLEASKVTLGTLMGKSYIDDVVDYEGNNCDTEGSYVIVIREGKNDYNYQVCLKCPNDDYDNTKDNKYCNSSWTNSAPKYGLGNIDTIYVYKGTSRYILEEKTKIPVSVVKYDDVTGEKIEEVSGEGEENVPYISPKNLDVVDTNVVGEYTIEYEYRDNTILEDGTVVENVETSEGTVIVYENEAPTVNVTYKNIVATERTTSETVRGNYTEGDWVQELTITFGREKGLYGIKNSEGICPDGTKDCNNTDVSRFQWKRGGKWEDLCTDINYNGNVAPYASCTVTIGPEGTNDLGQVELNENVQFRIIDTEGNISKVSRNYDFKLDRTPPSCDVKISGTMGNNNWYVSDVDVSLINIRDNLGVDNAAISGVKYYTSDMSQVNARTVTTGNHGTITGVQNKDTSSVTWYGFIEDNAKNYSICSKNFKRDATDPYADWDPASEGPHNNNTGITVTGTCNDKMSGAIAFSDSFDIKSPTEGKKVSINCTDNAGNTSSPSKTYKVAKLCQSSYCEWDSCLTTTSECAYGCDSVYDCDCPSGQPIFSGSNSCCDAGGVCTSASCGYENRNCSSCHHKETVCHGGYETCWALYCRV